MKVYILVDEKNFNNMCTVYATRKQAEKEWDRLAPVSHSGYHIEECKIIGK